MSAPDEAWRRPDGVAEPATPAPQPVAAYEPPPRMQLPPPWVGPGPLLAQPAPPPPLPEQDHAAIDAEEARALTVTVGFAIGAAGLAVILVIFLLIRQLF